MNKIERKQYVIVPRKPKMSKGKIASQVAHATFMALEKQRKLIEEEPDYMPGVSDDIISKWKETGMCVIILECKNTEQLISAAKYLEQWRIAHHLYIDEGLTEVDPMTPTALATGVLPKECHWMLSQFNTFKG
jgi:peptidyl-tRNA hydrolase